MRYFHAGIAAAICVVAVFAVGGCSQPKSGTYFEPEITASHDGIFSADVTFWLNSVNRIDWSRGDDDTVTSSKTPVGTVLRDVTLNVTVHYSQGADHETQAFDAKWQIGSKLVINVPKTATIQGYNIKGTGYLFDESGECLGTVPIDSGFRTTSE